MAKLAHSMIRVIDEDRAVTFYKTAFDLKVKDRLDFDGFTLIYMISEGSDFELELTINKDRSEPYDLGNGYGHIAFVVDDLDAMHGHIRDLGAYPKDIVDFRPGGTRVARFFFVSDPDGYQIEVIEKGGRFI
ncbi:MULTISPECIES: VOC family protein [unclassified Ruegeria]|uniref:VOC family protein n=1 Tax=unclassified Ruegeria TaxID=2625375 RepID=UPI001ADD3B11|nr:MULTISPECIES: VOC family protein [unclassified Ruegeria]MBO9411014.1 VOC family protein [Ruegeria sp. R8_1]MBO9415215.1 VOC family protein [Ruegeria sp. R8_2]